MTATIPNELVDEIIIKELESACEQFTDKLKQLVLNKFDDIPTYSTDLVEEYTCVQTDLRAFKHVLEYYKGPTNE